MSFAFGRNKRLCSAADFKQVFVRTDIKVGSRHLLILARVNHLGYSRLGLVIAKKNIRFATARNRVKRHIRETFRLSEEGSVHLDIVVLARKGLSKLGDRDMNNLLLNQWLKLNRKRVRFQASGDEVSFY